MTILYRIANSLAPTMQILPREHKQTLKNFTPSIFSVYTFNPDKLSHSTFTSFTLSPSTSNRDTIPHSNFDFCYVLTFNLHS
jgi:hypothetical protein